MAMTEEEYLDYLINNASKHIMDCDDGHAIGITGLNMSSWLIVTPEGKVKDWIFDKEIQDENLSNAVKAYVAMHKLSG